MNSERLDVAALAPFIAMMAAVVAASNYLVQYPFQYLGLSEVLTWGAFTYPVAFFVNDLTNRRFGPRAARRVVLTGFVLAVALSIWLATPRIALASGTAFLVAQLLDTAIFDHFRRQAWWRAPLVSSVLGSIIDTIAFFGIAFSAQFALVDAWTGYPDGSLAMPVSLFAMQIPLWVSLALGDLGVKLIIALALLLPYGLVFSMLRPLESRSANLNSR